MQFSPSILARILTIPTLGNTWRGSFHRQISAVHSILSLVMLDYQSQLACRSGLRCLIFCVYERVDISMMVTCNASDVVEYNRRRP